MSKFTAAEIFSDFMVLQRGKNITIFGTGDEGVEIFGELGGFRASCRVRGGRWKMTFPPMGAARYMRLKLMDADNDEVIRFDNVAIGEVWLAGGKTLALSGGGKIPETAADTSGDIRFYGKNGWSELTPENSAALCKFASMLSSHCDAAVGVVYLSDEDFENAVPYTANGVLYYDRGINESDASQYLDALIGQIIAVRMRWSSDELPFIVGTLPLCVSKSQFASVIREAQSRVYSVMKNTGLAVMLDLNEEDPADAEAVGQRFAAQVLHLVYGGYDGAFAPAFSNAVWRGEIVELHFDYAVGGFKTGGSSEGFEICGDDGVYVPAFADVSGERIFLSSDEVARPRGVRYLWSNFAECPIKNGFGLPLSPFRISIN